MGFILWLLLIFAGSFVFFKFLRPAKSPAVAAAIATIIIQFGIWCLPLIFKAIGALFTLMIVAFVLAIIFFLWKKLQTKI